MIRTKNNMDRDIGDVCKELEDVKPAEEPVEVQAKEPEDTGHVGRLRIVLVETPPSEYQRRELVAALIMAAYVLMGSINVSMTYYALLWWQPVSNHLHTLLCTSSMTFFTPTAILFYNRLSGSGRALEDGDRQRSHTIMHFVSFGLMFVGACCVFSWKKMKFSDSHTFISTFAVTAVFANVVLGFVMARDERPQLDVTSYRIPPLYLRLGHRIFGVVALWACCASFITGLFKIGPIIGWSRLLPEFIFKLLEPVLGLRYYLSALCVIVTMISSGHALFRSYF